MNEAYQFLAKGGVVMIPIALCSVIALTIFLERLWALQRQRVLPDQFMSLLRKAIRERRWERARSLCDSNESTVSRVARSALRYIGRKRNVVRDALQEAGRREVSYLERFISALGAIASVAPLIGLLGTVTGMIKVFGRVAEEYDKGGEVNAGMLANGIWEALITTAAGLTVAIPVFLMFRYLMSRVDRYVVELETFSSEVVDLIVDNDDTPDDFLEESVEDDAGDAGAVDGQKRKNEDRPSEDRKSEKKRVREPAVSPTPESA